MIGRRGSSSVSALVGVPTLGALTAMLLGAGVQPWLLALWGLGGALVGGLAVFIGHRWWGAQMLGKLDSIDRQLGAVATETSIASSETSLLRAEIARLRQALGILPAGLNPPPPPTSRERP